MHINFDNCLLHPATATTPQLKVVVVVAEATHLKLPIEEGGGGPSSSNRFGFVISGVSGSQ